MFVFSAGCGSLTLLLAGLSLHAGIAEPGAPQSTPPSGKEAVPAPGLQRAPAGVGRLLVHGTVVGVKLADRSLELRTTNGLQRLVVSTNAHLLRVGQRQKFEDIRPGDRASAVVGNRPDGTFQVLMMRLSTRQSGLGNDKRVGPRVPNQDLPRE